MPMDDVIELGKDVAGMKRDIANLQGWQKTQNGTLQRIDAKIDKLVYWLMGEMAAVILLAVSIFLKGR